MFIATDPLGALGRSFAASPRVRRHKINAAYFFAALVALAALTGRAESAFVSWGAFASDFTFLSAAFFALASSDFIFASALASFLSAAALAGVAVEIADDEAVEDVAIL